MAKKSSLNDRRLVQRMEQQNGIRTVNHAATIGLGSKAYDLVRL
jgi:uncharacterized Fe-S center protein